MMSLASGLCTPALFPAGHGPLHHARFIVGLPRLSTLQHRRRGVLVAAVAGIAATQHRLKKLSSRLAATRKHETSDAAPSSKSLPVPETQEYFSARPLCRLCSGSGARAQIEEATGAALPARDPVTRGFPSGVARRALAFLAAATPSLSPEETRAQAEADAGGQVLRRQVDANLPYCYECGGSCFVACFRCEGSGQMTIFGVSPPELTDCLECDAIGIKKCAVCYATGMPKGKFKAYMQDAQFKKVIARLRILNNSKEDRERIKLNVRKAIADVEAKYSKPVNT